MGLVSELRSSAIDQNSDISELVRKAFAAASLLQLDEFRDWANLEMSGYSGTTKPLPNYRQVPCAFVLQHPIHGWKPISLPDIPEFSEALGTCYLTSSVSLLQGFAREPESFSSFRFRPPLEAELRNLFNGMSPAQRVARPVFAEILNNVQTTVLKWCMKLETTGITGAPHSFNEREKEIAGRKESELRPNITYNINVIQIDSMINSAIQQASANSTLQITPQFSDRES